MVKTMVLHEQLEILFVVTALLFQSVLIVHVALRKLPFETAKRYGPIVYALRLPSFVVSMCLILISGCTPPASGGTHTPPATRDTFGLSNAELAALDSIVKLDDYPLYTMTYAGAYPSETNSLQQVRASTISMVTPASNVLQIPWGCSLFVTQGDKHGRLYGRNFDWEFSPAILLFTNPPDGYASVSMVDIAYLGFEGSRARNLLDFSIVERKSLLAAPYFPFDGMNEKGLAVGMAAVPPGDMKFDPEKETVDELRVIREILDHAATVDEAITILGSYNIDMGNVPIHYLIAEGASPPGGSALVEFYRGEMVILRNDLPWQQATNFLVASMNENPAGACQRYDLISERLSQAGGQINVQEALSLLSDVSQEITQWSVVYNMTDGSVHLVMGQDYETVHTVHINITRK